jgi:hypothetical protein
MFDLEQSITEWRRQMLAAGIKTPVPLDELETHLRDEIERQMKSWLSEQEAFENSVLRIGRADALKTEFNKTGGAKKRFDPALARVVLYSAIVAFGWILIMGFHAFWKYEMNLAWRLAGVADMATITLSVLGWRWMNRAFPVIPDKRIRAAIGIVCGCFGAVGMIVFMKFVLPNFEFTEGQLTVVVLWGLTLMAGCGVILAGLEEAARKRNIMANS